MTTRDEVSYLLTLLQQNYGLAITYACSAGLARHLPLLRALEREGLVTIHHIGLEKCWVSTAAGAIWLEVERCAEKGEEKPNFERDILGDIRFGWMTRTEAENAQDFLINQGFAIRDWSRNLFLKPGQEIPGQDVARYRPVVLETNG